MQILALFLAGVGLLLVSAVALVILYDSSQAAESNDRSQTGSGSPPSAVPVRVDFPAPDLNLHDLLGEPVSLANYRGQIVLINNWATWCPPCKAEMPVLQTYFENHRRQGFTIIAIESGEPASQVADFTAQYGLSFPVWVDPEQSAMETFQNFNLPSSYVVDRNGNVRLAWTGAISEAMLEKYVTPLLEE